MMYGYGTTHTKWAKERRKEELLRSKKANAQHVSHLFNLADPRCKRSTWTTSNKQCPDNPNCFVELGADVRKQSDKSIIKKRMGEDPGERLKEEEVPVVGLKNLGATCYMNALLQTLFQNHAFRQAIYMWEPLPGEFEGDSEDEAEIELGDLGERGAGEMRRDMNVDDRMEKQRGVSKSESMPTLSSSCEGKHIDYPHTARGSKEDGAKKLLRNSVCYQLQMLFAHMQLGQEKYLRPEALVKALGLNPHIQQDSQEFYKLIITFLEKKFSSSENATLRGLITEQFMGEFFYITTCTKCSRVTKQPGVYYEIDLRIPPHKDVKDCLETYFDEEEIEDFACEDCKVPSVDDCLAFRWSTKPSQLMRFVYDVKSGRKRKITADVKFHREMDMSPYMQGEEDGAMYTLMSIVCHIGPSAHGGHYISYTRVEDYWYRVDDAVVTRCKDYPFGPSRTHMLSMGLYGQSDRRADKNESPYLLVYYRKGYAFVEEPAIGERAVEAVLRKTELFKRRLDEYAQKKDLEIDSVKAMKSQFEEVYSNMAVDDLQTTSYHWIGVDWLKKWLRGCEEMVPIDNSDLLCKEHGKVCHVNLRKMKRISPTAWKYLHDAFGGGPELTHDDCCLDCVEAWLETSRERKTLSDEKRRVRDIVTSESYSYGYGSTRKGFWISRTWYRQWEDCKPSELAGMLPDRTFDIVCPHGGLVTGRDVRRVIPAKAWTYFQEKYPCADTRTFPYPETKPCAECSGEQDELNRIKRKRENERYRARADLSSVHRLAGRYYYREYCRTGEKYYILSSSWLQEWKAFIDDASIESLEPIDNSGLICEHGLLAYDITAIMISLGNGKKGLVDRLSPSEWAKLHSRYGGGPEILWTVVRHVGTDWEATTEPEMCAACAALRTEQDRLASLDFERAKVTVKQGDSAYAYGREITVSSSDPVLDVKMKVYEKYDIPPFQQMLWFGDVVLKDDSKTARDYELTPGCTLRVYKVPHVEGYDVVPMGEGAKETGFEGTKLTAIGSPIISSHLKRKAEEAEKVLWNGPGDRASTPPPASAGDGGCHASTKHATNMLAVKGDGDAVEVDATADSDEWPCQVCTFLNPASSRATMICTICETDNSATD